MKRAVFKIGSKIGIKSTFTDNGGLMSFRVPVDVNAWLAAGDGNWDFDIEGADNLAAPGVQIDVTDLNEAAAQSFESPRFIQDLRRVRIPG